MNKNLLKMAVSVGTTLPLFAFAQSDVFSILTVVEDIIARVIPIVMAVATIVFLWGIVMYITAAGDEKKAATAKSYITTGLLGLFFMVAIWGVVKALTATFGVEGQGIPSGPGRY